MALNVKGFALSSGVLLGLAILVVTLVAAARGIGSNLSHLSAIFIGYDVTYVGSVIGLIYGLVAGLIAGSVFALTYNASLGTKS